MKPKIIESVTKPKKPNSPSGDFLLATDDYIAVIDGATPKGARLWDKKRGDEFVSAYIGEVIKALPADILAEEAIKIINGKINEAYLKFGTSYMELPPEERLQASLVIYSVKRREIWSFGDCKFRVNEKTYDQTRLADNLLSDLRALYFELYKNEGKESKGDLGREAIMPFLKEAIKLANTDGEFGYDAINGGPVKPENTLVVPVKEGDFVVLASDGYPELFDTLEETESYLFEALKKDPDCINELRSTKGIVSGNESFDDRTYISFTI